MGCGSSSYDTLGATLRKSSGDSTHIKLLTMEYNEEDIVSSAPAVDPRDMTTNLVTAADPNSQLISNRKGLKNFGTAKMELEEVYVELDKRFSELQAIEDYASADCKDNLLFIREVSMYGRGNTEKKQAVAEYVFKKGLTEIFCRVWQYCFPLDFLSKENKDISAKMRHVMIGLWNSTDRSKALCDHVIEMNLHKDIFHYLQNEKMNPEDLGDKNKLFFVKGLLGVLHNVVQSCTVAREEYRECGAVALLRKFRASSNDMVKLKASLLLAYIITEEENEEINADSKNFAFLVSIFVSALKSPDHRSKKYGFQAVELMTGLNKLAANDANKDRIVDSGVLPFYTRLLQPESSNQEQEEAARGIWILSFKCKDAIREEPGCMEALRLLSETTNTTETVRKMANGALWILEDHIITETHTMETSKDVPHVMISYQWGCQSTMLKIKTRLVQAGYKVWMDVDDLRGSVLEAMGEAVDNAAVILVALSHKYKESPNCRTEGNYAFSLKKPIVPLKLEPKYKPDGWLGALVGVKLYFDFSHPSRFESSLSKLITELGDRGKNLINDKVTVAKVPALGATKPRPSGDFEDGRYPSPTRTGVGGWMSADVECWLVRNGLDAHKEALADIDGSLLLEMHALLLTAPEFFCSTLKNDFHFSFVDILKFNKAVKQLM